MANPDHLAELKKGVKSWNAWRKKNPELIPDLSEVEVTEADLVGVHLSESILVGTDLNGANLSQADLVGANLSEANLVGAGLNGADLAFANLSHVTLDRANFTNAILFETVLADLDLSTAKGLDGCEHVGPSTVDFRTLQRSGPLPVAFLRGCGLSDPLIEYLRALFQQPIQFESCFISYSTRDQDFATRLYADLQNRGVRCWFAPHDMQGGKILREQIDEAIHVRDRVLLILSKHSMNSDWVKVELTKAYHRGLREKRKVLFPIRLVDYESICEWKHFDHSSGVDLAREVDQFYIPDFSNWKDQDSYQAELEKLLNDLRHEVPNAKSGTAERPSGR